MSEWIPLTPHVEVPAEGVEWKMRVFHRRIDEPDAVVRYTYWSFQIGLITERTISRMNYHVLEEVEVEDAPTVNEKSWRETMDDDEEVVWRCDCVLEDDMAARIPDASPLVQYFFRHEMNDYVMK